METSFRGHGEVTNSDVYVLPNPPKHSASHTPGKPLRQEWTMTLCLCTPGFPDANTSPAASKVINPQWLGHQKI